MYHTNSNLKLLTLLVTLFLASCARDPGKKGESSQTSNSEAKDNVIESSQFFLSNNCTCKGSDGKSITLNTSQNCKDFEGAIFSDTNTKLSDCSGVAIAPNISVAGTSVTATAGNDKRTATGTIDTLNGNVQANIAGPNGNVNVLADPLSGSPSVTLSGTIKSTTFNGNANIPTGSFNANANGPNGTIAASGVISGANSNVSANISSGPVNAVVNANANGVNVQGSSRNTVFNSSTNTAGATNIAINHSLSSAGTIPGVTTTANINSTTPNIAVQPTSSGYNISANVAGTIGSTTSTSGTKVALSTVWADGTTSGTFNLGANASLSANKQAGTLTASVTVNLNGALNANVNGYKRGPLGRINTIATLSETVSLAANDSFQLTYDCLTNNVTLVSGNSQPVDIDASGNVQFNGWFPNLLPRLLSGFRQNLSQKITNKLNTSGDAILNDAEANINKVYNEKKQQVINNLAAQLKTIAAKSACSESPIPSLLQFK